MSEQPLLPPAKPEPPLWLVKLQRALRVADAGLAGWREMERPRAFVLMVGVLLIFLLLWSMLSRVDRVVRAEGRVVPASRSQVIQHLEGGIVSAISTREGSVVKKGDVLLSISDTGAGSRLGELQVKMTALRAKIARLKAEIDGVAPNGSKAGTGRQDAELRYFQERQAKIRAEIEVLREQSKQKEAELADLLTRKSSIAQELETARSQLQVLSGLQARRAASQLEVLESRGKLERMETQYRETEGAIPKIKATIGEYQAKIRVAQSQFRTDASGELTAAQIELDRMMEEERVEQDRLARTDVRAPADGMVNRLYFTTLGGVVRPGDTIMEITPLDGKMVIEGKVQPTDRGELVVGLPARARITAYDFGVYGTLPGRLVEVSADTVSEEKVQQAPKTFYRVQVEIDPTAYTNKGLSILPGMTSNVDIVIGQRSIMQYLLSPLLRFNYQVFQESR